MAGYDQTPWGLKCTALYQELLVDFPTLLSGIGPDAKSLLKAPPAITFFNPRGGAEQSPTISGASKRNPFDDLVRVDIEIWMSDAVQAYLVYQKLLIAVNKVLHGRNNSMGSWRPGGESIGEHGAKLTTSVMIRVPAYAPALVTRKPETQLPEVSTLNPAGNVEEEADLATG